MLLETNKQSDNMPPTQAKMATHAGAKKQQKAQPTLNPQTRERQQER